MATLFGHVSYDVTSTSERTHVKLTRDIRHARADRLGSIVLYLRRPDGAAPVEIRVNGVTLPLTAYDGETITLGHPAESAEVEAIY